MANDFTLARQVLPDRAARNLGAIRQFIDARRVLRHHKSCQQLLLGIADDHAQPPFGIMRGCNRRKTV